MVRLHPDLSGTVHPDLTAIRAVDACGGTYSLEQTESGWAAGHTSALCDAMKAVVDADALTSDLLTALQCLMHPDIAHVGPHAGQASIHARAVIAKAVSQ